MSDTCRGGDVAPRTFAALDEWDKTLLVADLDRRRRDRLQREAAGKALAATETEVTSESLDAEGEQ